MRIILCKFASCKEEGSLDNRILDRPAVCSSAAGITFQPDLFSVADIVFLVICFCTKKL